jgi:hypothetical protein
MARGLGVSPQNPVIPSLGLFTAKPSNALYTDPMNRTSPESTYGFVVNHSQRKTEAGCCQPRSTRSSIVRLTFTRIDGIS